MGLGRAVLHQAQPILQAGFEEGPAQKAAAEGQGADSEERTNTGREHMIEKYCITCKQNGHIYLECTELSFGDILQAAFGAPFGLPSGKPMEQYHADAERLSFTRATDGKPDAEL